MVRGDRTSDRAGDEVTPEETVRSREGTNILAAKIHIGIVLDGIERVCRYVTLGDVVPWSSVGGAAGEWADVQRQMKQCILLR